MNTNAAAARATALASHWLRMKTILRLRTRSARASARAPPRAAGAHALVHRGSRRLGRKRNVIDRDRERGFERARARSGRASSRAAARDPGPSTAARHRGAPRLPAIGACSPHWQGHGAVRTLAAALRMSSRAQAPRGPPPRWTGGGHGVSEAARKATTNATPRHGAARRTLAGARRFSRSRLRHGR